MSGRAGRAGKVGLVAAALLLMAGLTLSQDRRPQRLTDEEKLYGLALVWKEVDHNFAFFDQVPDLDWDAAYREFIPQVLAAESVFEYYRTLQRFLCLLRDGHTNIYFPDRLDVDRWVDRPWILLREIQRRAIVSNVEPALAARIPVGSEILAVDGTPVREHLESRVFPYVHASSDRMLWSRGIAGSRSSAFGLLWGPAGTDAQIEIRTPDGDLRTVVARRDRSSRRSEYLPALPDPSVLEYEQLEDGFAYVSLNTFGDRSVVSEFEAIIPALCKARGVILDLRRNGGGSDSNHVPILRVFATDTLVGPAWRTRVHNAVFKAWGADARDKGSNGEYWEYLVGEAWEATEPGKFPPTTGKKITVPVIALMGRSTASAAENFLVVLHPIPNVILVGEPTAGTTGQPLRFDLPGGGEARVVVKRNTYADGREYMGVGIQPDVLVELTLEDLLEGRDPALATALEILRESHSSPPDGR